MVFDGSAIFIVRLSQSPRFHKSFVPKSALSKWQKNHFLFCAYRRKLLEKFPVFDKSYQKICRASVILADALQ